MTVWTPPEPEWLREASADVIHFLKSLRTEDDMSTALIPVDGVDTATGEIIPLPARYDAKAYLQGLQGGAAIQQQLAAAYDAAVNALIGPNDVQVEGGRSFKKKSAWRKLARHFGISTRVVHRDRGMVGEDFVASITVRAIAPWGQSAEAEGACGTDEESGRREITIADAIATAETRATNRAISNLIAMGEVSADEISEGRKPRGGGNGSQRGPESKVMPFGKLKGTKLGEIESADLLQTLEWCREKDATKFAELIAALEQVLDGRRVEDVGIDSQRADYA